MRRYRLPLRPAPLPEELLSSWIVRLAYAHGMKLQSFCHELWPTRNIWNRDPDRSADDRLMQSLSELTGVSFEAVRATTLRAYEGVLFRRQIRNGNTRWLMPLGIYHRVRKRSGLQVCPLCLRSDRIPYYRRIWRLSLFTTCSTHGTVLLDGCPRCEKPIHLHRSEMGRRNEFRFDNNRCYNCGYLFADTPPKAADARLHAVHLLHEALLGGRFSFPQETISYFDVLGHILRLLTSTRPRLRKFQENVSAMTNTQQAPVLTLARQRLCLHFDSLPVEVRAELLAAAFHLIQCWPTAMAEAFGRSHLRNSDVLRDFTHRPDWYKDFLVLRSAAQNLSLPA